MRRLLLVPACLIGFACQSSQYVTREELRSMIALPPSPADEGASVQKCDLDELVAGAFAAPEAATRAAAAMAATDQKMAPLTSALSAIDQAFSVSANNLANAETTAFKRTYAVSEPNGTATFKLDFEQGSMENTGRQLDCGIQGQGFFRVQTTKGEAYTRNGNFFINKDGDVVLGMGDGYKVEPKITVPSGVTDVSISTDGKVTVMRGGTLAPTSIGQLEIFQFPNPQGLNWQGGSLYLETKTSGNPISGKPGDNGAGQTLQGFLEGSNVDPMKERLRMRFLQNWRATILRVINENQSDKAAPAKPSELKSTNAAQPTLRSNEPQLARAASPSGAIINNAQSSTLVSALRAIDCLYSVSANNLANAKTVGFKSSRVNLEDLQAHSIKAPGTVTANGEVSPAGIAFGTGVKIASTQLNTEQGSIESTSRPLDVAIQGQGYFKVKILATLSDGFGYTRNGNFFVNKDGNLGLSTDNDYILDPKIAIPKGATDISITKDGKVKVTKAGEAAPAFAGQIQLHQFINAQGLNLLGGSIYTETESSGRALSSAPGSDGAGLLQQGFLEASNVKPEDERLHMKMLDNWRATILAIIDQLK